MSFLLFIIYLFIFVSPHSTCNSSQFSHLKTLIMAVLIRKFYILILSLLEVEKRYPYIKLIILWGNHSTSIFNYLELCFDSESLIQRSEGAKDQANLPYIPTTWIFQFNPLTPKPAITGRDEPWPFFHF